MKANRVALVVLTVLAFTLLAGCSSLSVRIPDGMFVSSGDYVPGVRTEGIVQVHKQAWTPFFVLYDASKVREALYKELLSKVDSMVGVEGITNVSFYSKPSPLSVMAPFTLGLGIWVDHYAEGVVITLE